MTSALLTRRQWIKQFVAAAADPADAVDVEYATILGGQLFDQLQQMTPEDVAAALIGSRTLPVRGLLAKPDKPDMPFGDL